MNTKTQRKVECIRRLAGIWFVGTLRIPWIIADPDVAKPQLTVILQMIAFISIPFVAVAVAWILKPELTRNA